VALHEATDVLHRAMHLMPYHPGGMVIKVVVNFPEFFVVVDSVVVHNHS
jgi:hypothetical protein